MLNEGFNLRCPTLKKDAFEINSHRESVFSVYIAVLYARERTKIKSRPIKN